MRAHLVLISCLLFIWPSGAFAQDAARFDGRWSVTLACPRGPDGAFPFTFHFAGDVKNATLHGENGRAGEPGWLSLDGPIRPDGSAQFDAHGLTGNPDYNYHQMAKGIPYYHLVKAHFDGDMGAGSWTTNRQCDFTFRKM